MTDIPLAIPFAELKCLSVSEFNAIYWWSNKDTISERPNICSNPSQVRLFGFIKEGLIESHAGVISLDGGLLERNWFLYGASRTDNNGSHYLGNFSAMIRDLLLEFQSPNNNLMITPVRLMI
jgi:hypothetical protein